MPEERPDATHAPRRSFLTGVAAILVGGLAGLVPTLTGAVALFDPLRRKRPDSGMTLVTKLAVLPEDGTPRKFTVSADRVDGWTTHADTPVGAVYLRRVGDGVRALNVACPHAGCFVGIADGGAGFACPCHKSSFDLDGEIDDPASPAPRAMDALDVELRNEGEVWVHFQSFQAGQAEKRPLV